MKNGPQTPNGIWLSTDARIHAPASAGNNICLPCRSGSGYPQPHAGCRKGGFLHAEERFDMEAGFETKYLITRCDQCGKEGLIE